MIQALQISFAYRFYCMDVYLYVRQWMVILWWKQLQMILTFTGHDLIFFGEEINFIDTYQYSNRKIIWKHGLNSTVKKWPQSTQKNISYKPDYFLYFVDFCYTSQLPDYIAHWPDFSLMHTSELACMVTLL